MNSDENCDFEQKVFFGTLTNSQPLTHFGDLAGTEPKKWKFCSKVDFGPIIQFWSQKVIFDAKNEFLDENEFLRPHVADAYKTNGILTKMDVFLVQSRFLNQKWVLDPKIDFWAQKSKNRPKRRLWAQKCAFSQK